MACRKFDILSCCCCKQLCHSHDCNIPKQVLISETEKNAEYNLHLETMPWLRRSRINDTQRRNAYQLVACEHGAKKITRAKSAISSPGNPGPNLEKDIEREHCVQPNEKYSLPKDVINENAIKRWWQSFHPNEEYRVTNQNCCHVVFKALEVGNTTKCFEDEATKSLGKTLLTPLDIKALVESLIKGHT